MFKTRTVRAFTLFEVLLVTGLFVVLLSLVMPAMLRKLDDARMPSSCRSMRALIQLTRANAMIEGRRYRIRFPRQDEIDAEGRQRQPIVEVERDPLREPEVFTPVLASWARDVVFDDSVRCAKVVLGRPTIESMMGESDAEAELIETGTGGEGEEDEAPAMEGEVFDEDFPPIYLEPDGMSEWATFVITDAPLEVDIDEAPEGEHQIIDLIFDGLTGLAWLQRRLYQEELEMMRDHGWPPVMRKDFLDPTLLTEDDVLEIREQLVRKK
jgi:hypothetical protein